MQQNDALKEYVKKEREKMARELLLNTDLSLEEIKLCTHLSIEEIKKIKEEINN